MRGKAGTILFMSAILSRFLALCGSREHGTALFKGMQMKQRIRWPTYTSITQETQYFSTNLHLFLLQHCITLIN